MSRQEVEIVQAGLAALNRRDVEGMLATLQPDAELVPARAVLEGGAYRGHAGLRQWFEDMAEDWDDFRIESYEVRDLKGSRVLVLARFHARGKSSGVKVDQPAAWICRLVEGKVAHIRFFPDEDAALSAAGGPADA